MIPRGPDPKVPRNEQPARFAALTLAVLWIEAMAAAFWPAATVVGAFLVLALLGVPAALPATLHAALLGAFALALALTVWRGARQFRRPTPANALRRLERDSHLSHRPFEALEDRPVEAGPVADALWRLHQTRRRAEIRRLRISLPAPGLPERDPRAFRFGVLIALAVAIVIAGPRAGRLILSSLEPGFGTSIAPAPIDAWIKPPDYTGLPPILLKADTAQPIAVPTGSLLVAHVSGGTRVPHLTLDDFSQDFKKADSGGFGLTATLSIPGQLAIRRGWAILARWRIAIIPDTPPSVDFVLPPEPMQSGALRIDYQATDDYGVATIGLRIRPLPGPPPPNQHPIAGEPIAPVLASGQTDKSVRGASFQDFAAHPWAGTKVLAKLVATDAAGQTGESPEIPLTLPERNFAHPVARAIIAERKHLILGDFPPPLIAVAVAGIADRPEAYTGDFSVFLALHTAATALTQPTGDDVRRTDDILDLLWNAALKIEDGDRPEADKALRAAENALEQALKDPKTPDSEIARLTQALKEAIGRDIAALIENLRQRQARGEQIPMPQPGQNAQMIDPKALADQIDRMRQMAQNGSREAAQNMLSSLESLLENLRGGSASGQANEKGEKALAELKDLARRQRVLQKNGGSGAAEEQEALRRSLGDAARDIDEATGGIPQEMSGADRAMRNAARALRSGQGDAQGDARDEQQEAADQLDQAIQGLSQKLSQQGMAVGNGQGQGGSDPLGRAQFDPGKSVKVPTDREMQRSREILDELRRRSGDRERPRSELDYIRRLLNQF